MKPAAEKNRVKRWLAPQYLVTLILALVITGAVTAVVILQRDPVVAVVNGEKIRMGELYDALYAQSGEEVLEDIIYKRLIFQEAKKLGLAVSSADVDAEIKKLVDEQFMGDDQQLLMVLAQYGMTIETLKDNARVYLTVEKILRSRLTITDEEAAAYFNENRETFNIPEEVKARHILVETEAEADEIIALLKGGADFAVLAGERSKDPGSKSQGGDLGFFNRNYSMYQEFLDAAFALAVGEVSAPVKSPVGYHVIEVLERKPTREVDFAEAKDRVKDAIFESKYNELRAAFDEQIWREAKIEYK
jgi:foldase protein PrsA